MNKPRDVKRAKRLTQEEINSIISEDIHEFSNKVGNTIRKITNPYEDLTEENKAQYFSQLKSNKDFIRKAFEEKKYIRLVILKYVEDLIDIEIQDKEIEGTGTNRFTVFGLDMLSELIPAITKAMREDSMNVGKGMEAFIKLISFGNEKQKHEGFENLVKSANLIIDALSEDTSSWQYYIGFIDKIFENGTPEQLQEFTKTFEKAINTIKLNKLPFFATILFFKSGMSEKRMDLCWVGVKKALERMGLPAGDFITAWMVSGKVEEYTLSRGIRENLIVIAELEQAKPGTSLFLYKEFGIMDFGRYPKEMLQKQAEEFEDTSKPYGVIMYPRNDHNGAFYQDKNIFSDFLKSLNDEFSIRVVECEGKMDIAKYFIKLNRKYNPLDGSGHKISLVIIGGHGAKNNIKFGGEDQRHSLSVEDLMGKGTEKVSQFLEEKSTVILVSCSTGTERGIGQELSIKLKAKVIAPKIPTNLASLQAIKNETTQRFEFNAEFKTQEKNTFV